MRIELPPKIEEEVTIYLEKNKVPKEKRGEFFDKVKAFYKKARYDPMEAIGIVAAQSLSEPATQMSLDYDEKVIIKKDGKILIAKIGDFIDMEIGHAGKQDPDGWEVSDISGQNILVPSITNDENIEWKPLSIVSRHKSPEHLIEITTLSGRKIVATDSHSFVTRKDNRIVAVAGSSLSCGNRIPSIKDLPENCIHRLELKTIVESEDLKNLKKPLPEVLELDSLFGWFIGAYLAEGNSTKYYVSLSNTDEEFLSKVRLFASTLGLTTNEYDNNRGFSIGHDIRVNSTLLSKVMKKTCGTGSLLKKVPMFAYSAKEEFVGGLLKGYFDGDGNVSVDRRMIRASSNSRELLDGISLLLSRFGIFTSKHHDGKQHSIAIPYKYSPKFMEKIGFSHEKKAERLKRLCTLYAAVEGYKYQDFIDVIGGFGDILQRISRKLALPSRLVNSATNRQKIGRETLKRYILKFERIGIEKQVDIECELKILRTMASSDVIWDEIAGIKKVKPTSEHVYDFTVEGTQTFTTFDGIVTHNTMRTYHFAGTAGIQVTLGLPRMLEIFDARKEPRTPTMTVFVKPGLGIDEIKRIANEIKEVKIKDVVISTLLDLTDMWIKCKFDMERIKSLKIDPVKLAKKIKIKNSVASFDGDSLILTAKKSDVGNLRKLKYTLFETHLAGIKGISQVVVTKDNDEWIINTLGSNLKKVYAVEGVDPTRTVSNNLFEILDLLGVEAGREAIVRQAQYTMEEQGLGIDVRYIMLLADTMTSKATIYSIGRYGISGRKDSVLVRASFEETKKHFTVAAVRGEIDNLAGTVENIIMNQVAPVGTGAFDLIGSIPKKVGGSNKGDSVKKTAKSKTVVKKPIVKNKAKLADS